jgi:ribonuclease-3
MSDLSPRVPPEAEPRLAALQRRLKVKFREPRLLFHALVHRSAVNERPELQLTSNERLEFLGDAILGAIVAERLYCAYPVASEGVLTVTRASLVCEASLASWARALGLGEYLVLGRGEEIAQGRERDALLARSFEAVVGAMYLDRGLSRVARFLEGLVAPALGRTPDDRPLLDAKSRLQQRCQSERDAVPRYRVVEISGPQHGPTFVVEVEVGGSPIARGSGRSKRAAEQAAAEAALAAWDDESSVVSGQRSASSEATGDTASPAIVSEPSSASANSPRASAEEPSVATEPPPADEEALVPDPAPSRSRRRTRASAET